MEESSLHLLQQNEMALAPLCASYRKRLEHTWDERNVSPFAFVPTKVIREGICQKDAVYANKELGDFARRFLSHILEKSSEEDLCRRQNIERKIVGVGPGRGYDTQWVREAIASKLRTVWLDVSQAACEMAVEDLRNQFEKIPDYDKLGSFRPLVKCAEIRSTLIEPDSIGLDLDSVEIWYMCRVLGCLSEASAKIVLRILGTLLSEDSNKSLVIINALKDDNRDYEGSKNSKLLSMRFIINNLEWENDKHVEVVSVDTHRYFEKKVTAMYIKLG